MQDCWFGRWVAAVAMLSACGGRVDQSYRLEPEAGDGSSPPAGRDGQTTGGNWGVACEDPPSGTQNWNLESCSIQQVSVGQPSISAIVDLAVRENELLLLIGSVVSSFESVAAIVQRIALDGSPLADVKIEITRGARLLSDPDGFAIIDRAPSGDLRMRRFDLDGQLLETRVLRLAEKLMWHVSFNALWEAGELRVSYFVPAPMSSYANRGFVHHARFDEAGDPLFDVRLTDPAGFVTPGDIQPFCAGTLTTAYRTLDTGRSEVYLSFVDDAGGVVDSRVLDGDVPQRMNSPRASFLDRLGDGSFLITWLDTLQSWKEFSPGDALSIASIGYDGALRWEKKLALPSSGSSLTSAHWIGSEVRVAVADGQSAFVWRLSSEAELLGTEKLASRPAALHGLLPTPSGYASLSHVILPEGGTELVLSIATCTLTP